MLSSLFWLALGAFAIGTEGFMISGILPMMSTDLGVSIAHAGHLVTIFALTYAIGAPLIAVLTAGWPRKALLLLAMGLFALANIAAALAPGYGTLVLSRMLLAIAAGTFMPTASGYATIIAPPEKRGRALSLIYAGMTLAIVIGVPIGTMVAERLGWRATFMGVAILSAFAFLGILVALPRVATPAAIGLAERFATARRPDVLVILLLTVPALAGMLGFFTYFGAFAESTFHVSADTVALALFASGAAGAFGNILGGYAADRWDRQRYLAVVLAILAIAYASIALIGYTLGDLGGVSAVAALFMVAALIGWSFPTVQQARLVEIDPRLASITLSLNASAIYLGTAIGTGFGSLAIGASDIRAIGLVAAGFELVALAIVFVTMRRAVPMVRPA